MRRNLVKEAWAAGGVQTNGWLAIPSGYSAELMGHAGFDAVTVDFQHGMMGFDKGLDMLQALSATPTLPFARAAALLPAEIMHILDAGAFGIICPMISTPEQAEAFVSACMYPPRGTRSYGPARGLLYGGPDYFAKANDTIVKLAMIETAEGLDNLEAILATPDLEGVYIGPNDLAIALGAAPARESPDQIVVDAIAHILRTTRAAGKVAGIFCSSGETAAKRADEGFQLVTPANDAVLLGTAAKHAAAVARNGGKVAPGQAGGY